MSPIIDHESHDQNRSESTPVNFATVFVNLTPNAPSEIGDIGLSPCILLNISRSNYKQSKFGACCKRAMTDAVYTGRPGQTNQNINNNFRSTHTPRSGILLPCITMHVSRRCTETNRADMWITRIAIFP